tara:strand:+ start:688 stop:897 length:210 start_codon:yes stop_codon:yes gene_type:complete
MDDLKEDLLDTVAVLKEKLIRGGFKSWLLILISVAIGPFFYFLLTLSLVKITISAFIAIYFLCKRLESI